MLNLIGRGTAHTCDGISRRDFLQVGTLGAVGFALPDLLAARQVQAAVGKKDDKHDDRAVIMIFNLGAPSQLDTWDMKPDAPAEIRGPFKPIKTSVPEIQVSEIFPGHAKLADKFSLVRTCYHTAAAVHDTGHQMMQTGRLLPAVLTHRTRVVHSSICVAARPICRPTLFCRSQWDRPAEICRMDKTRASWERPMTRLC